VVHREDHHLRLGTEFFLANPFDEFDPGNTVKSQAGDNYIQLDGTRPQYGLYTAIGSADDLDIGFIIQGCGQSVTYDWQLVANYNAQRHCQLPFIAARYFGQPVRHAEVPGIVSFRAQEVTDLMTDEYRRSNVCKR
jgi:hypothetical protein